MDFLVPVWLSSVRLLSVGLPDLENVGLAVEILFLSHVHAKIKVFPVSEAAILDFPLPFWLYIILLCSIG